MNDAMCNYMKYVAFALRRKGKLRYEVVYKFFVISSKVLCLVLTNEETTTCLRTFLNTLKVAF